MRFAVLTLVVLAAPAARAQALTAGTWTGTLAPARGAAVAVEAALEACVEGWKVGLKVGGRDAGEATQVRWAENRLGFHFVEPGARRIYACALTRRADGTLGGTCTAPRQRPATLTLAPPASAAFGCTG